MSRASLFLTIALIAMLSILSTAWVIPQQVTKYTPNAVSEAFFQAQAFDTLSEDNLGAFGYSFSPLSKNATYFELFFWNLPTTTKNVEFTVDIKGFESGKWVSIKTLENSGTNPIDKSGREHLVKYTAKSNHFVFSAEFPTAANKTTNYNRGALFRFDSSAWTGAPSVRVSMREVETNTIHPLEEITGVIPESIGPLNVALTGKVDKDHQNKNFTFSLGPLEAPLDKKQNYLNFYSTFTEYALANPSNATSGVCTVTNGADSIKLSAEFRHQEPFAPTLAVLFDKLEKPLEQGKNYTFACPDFAVRLNHTKLHYSEYWVAITNGEPQRQSTHYVGGIDRVDKLVGWILIAILIGSIIGLIVFIAILVCLCKVCSCCCFSKNRASNSSINSNSYHRL